MLDGRPFADEPVRERTAHLVNGIGFLMLSSQDDGARKPDALRVAFCHCSVPRLSAAEAGGLDSARAARRFYFKAPV